MRKIAIISIIMALFVSAVATADECLVATNAELQEAVDSAVNDGGCWTDSEVYRKRYEDYRGGSLSFHVIRFGTSVSISASLPCLGGYKNNPLVIIAGDGVDATILSNKDICMDSSSGGVIFDGIKLKTPRVVISSDNNAILNSEIKGMIRVIGSSNFIVGSSVMGASGNGLDIFGDNNKIIDTKIGESERYGIFIRGYDTKVQGGRAYLNKAGGIYVETCGSGGDCKDPRSALISHVEFLKNEGRDIEIQKWPLVAPVNLVSVQAGTFWKIMGNIEDPMAKGEDYPWKDVNIKAVKVELYIKEGPFVAEIEEVNPNTGEFVFSLANPIEVDGQKYLDPIFVATAVDLESGNTSPFSSQLDTVNQKDWDEDGIPNDQEDYNHNGVVDFGETDPRKADTDGDGLTDGEERLRTGRVADLLASGAIFTDLSGLDPTNADSDGDCLRDGLEIGVSTPITEESVDAVSAMEGLVGSSAKPELLSPFCEAILKEHNIIYSATDFDENPNSITDPTNADSDGDGLKDGEEDWNFNGMRDEKNGEYLETDPSLPDTDGDTFLDGEEGDVNRNFILDENESDPLLKDTDGDGLADDVEITRFGSLPNNCDTDGDGLPDGVEGGVINPDPKDSECAGLQTAGTNFTSIGQLSPIKKDSDGDGINDGDEDANHNGWLDPDETDPTIEDTDKDGISDGIEAALDIDGDGYPDVDILMLENGKKCTPPESATDLDCDGVPNTRDDDSDNDGCYDREEGIHADENRDGIPDVWQQDVAKCMDASAGGGVPAAPVAPVPSAGGLGMMNPSKAIPVSEGGGACSLTPTGAGSSAYLIYLLLIFPTAVIFRYKKAAH